MMPASFISRASSTRPVVVIDLVTPPPEPSPTSKSRLPAECHTRIRSKARDKRVIHADSFDDEGAPSSSLRPSKDMAASTPKARSSRLSPNRPQTRQSSQQPIYITVISDSDLEPNGMTGPSTRSQPSRLPLRSVGSRRSAAKGAPPRQAVDEFSTDTDVPPSSRSAKRLRRKPPLRSDDDSERDAATLQTQRPGGRRSLRINHLRNEEDRVEEMIEDEGLPSPISAAVASEDDLSLVTPTRSRRQLALFREDDDEEESTTTSSCTNDYDSARRGSPENGRRENDVTPPMQAYEDETVLTTSSRSRRRRLLGSDDEDADQTDVRSTRGQRLVRREKIRSTARSQSVDVRDEHVQRSTASLRRTVRRRVRSPVKSVASDRSTPPFANSQKRTRLQSSSPEDQVPSSSCARVHSGAASRPTGASAVVRSASNPSPYRTGKRSRLQTSSSDSEEEFTTPNSYRSSVRSSARKKGKVSQAIESSASDDEGPEHITPVKTIPPSVRTDRKKKLEAMRQRRLRREGRAAANTEISQAPLSDDGGTAAAAGSDTVSSGSFVISDDNASEVDPSELMALHHASSMTRGSSANVVDDFFSDLRHRPGNNAMLQEWCEIFCLWLVSKEFGLELDDEHMRSFERARKNLRDKLDVIASNVTSWTMRKQYRWHLNQWPRLRIRHADAAVVPPSGSEEGSEEEEDDDRTVVPHGNIKRRDLGSDEEWRGNCASCPFRVYHCFARILFSGSRYDSDTLETISDDDSEWHRESDLGDSEVDRKEYAHCMYVSESEGSSDSSRTPSPYSDSPSDTSVGQQLRRARTKQPRRQRLVRAAFRTDRCFWRTRLLHPLAHWERHALEALRASPAVVELRKRIQAHETDSEGGGSDDDSDGDGDSDVSGWGPDTEDFQAAAEAYAPRLAARLRDLETSARQNAVRPSAWKRKGEEDEEDVAGWGEVASSEEE